MANALAATRLSHRTDESTSIERQKEQTSLTAKVRGDNLVFTTEDTDVSGAVSPFLRESLGPWLTDPAKVAQWDVLIVAKLDRLTRSLSDFDEMVKWLDQNGKTLVSVSESLDLATSTGRMFAGLLAMFAQFERERMSERRKDAGTKIRENGWWAGFGYPYGTMPVKVADHWELEINPDTYPQLETIAGQLLQGHSASSIAKRLNSLSVPTPAGGKEWRQNTIRDMFANPKCPLDYDLLAKVRESMDKSKQGWTKRGDAALLLNVAYCACGASLYSKRYTSKGRTYQYYDCSGKCGARRIPMADLEDAVDAHMENLTGPVYSKVVTKGKSNKSAITAIERKIKALDLDDPAYDDKHAELMAARKALRGTSSGQDSIEYKETFWSAGEYWSSLKDDKAVQRQFLLTSGIKANGCKRTPDGKVRVRIDSEATDFLVVS